MEFQRKRVYTAVNADELEAGDKVIVAMSVQELRDEVEKGFNVVELEAVLPEHYMDRFSVHVIKEGDPELRQTALAYLVERKENCTNCGEGRWDAEHQKIICNPVMCVYDNVVFRNHEIEVCEYWKPKAEQKAEPHYRPFKDTDELIKVWCEKAKATPPVLDIPYIWVRHKNLPKTKGMLINGFEQEVVYVMGTERTMQEVLDKFVFLDGSPCGVEE